MDAGRAFNKDLHPQPKILSVVHYSPVLRGGEVLPFGMPAASVLASITPPLYGPMTPRVGTQVLRYILKLRTPRIPENTPLQPSSL